MKRTALLLSFVVVGAVGAPAALASPDDAPGDGRRGRREARAERGDGSPARAGRRARLRHRRARLRRLAARLTPAQRETLLEARKAALAIRREAFASLRGGEDARREAGADGPTKDEREARRAKREEARAAAIEKTLPHARKVLDSLDSEQRARLLRAASRRGLEATDDALARRLAKRLLTKPGGARRLARLARLDR
jgi:hypothetical protein